VVITAGNDQQAIPLLEDDQWFVNPNGCNDFITSQEANKNAVPPTTTSITSSIRAAILRHCEGFNVQCICNYGKLSVYER
jgi:hypothetical protein